MQKPARKGKEWFFRQKVCQSHLEPLPWSSLRESLLFTLKSCTRLIWSPSLSSPLSHLASSSYQCLTLSSWIWKFSPQPRYHWNLASSRKPYKVWFHQNGPATLPPARASLWGIWTSTWTFPSPSGQLYESSEKSHTIPQPLMPQLSHRSKCPFNWIGQRKCPSFFMTRPEIQPVFSMSSHSCENTAIKEVN